MNTNLGFPPPLPHVHVTVNLGYLVFIDIVLLRLEDQIWCEFWISIKSTNALNNVPVVEVQSLASNGNFTPAEFGMSG